MYRQSFSVLCLRRAPQPKFYREANPEEIPTTIHEIGHVADFASGQTLVDLVA